MASFSPNIIAESFTSCATYNPGGEIVIYGNRRIKWKDFVRRVFKTANALINLGVSKDEKIAFMFHNTPEFLETNFGIQVAGAIPCPMNYRFVSNEIEYQGNHSDASVFIFDSIWSETIVPAMKKLPKIKHFICKGQDRPENTISYDDFVDSGEEKDPGIGNKWEDVAVMIYTGGTTGFPKGVMLTYKGHLDMFSVLAASMAVRTLTMDMPVEQHKKMIADSNMPLTNILGAFYRSNFFKNFMKKPKTLSFFQEKVRKSLMDPKSMRKGYKNVRKAMYPSKIGRAHV